MCSSASEVTDCVSIWSQLGDSYFRTKAADVVPAGSRSAKWGVPNVVQKNSVL